MIEVLVVFLIFAASLGSLIVIILLAYAAVFGNTDTAYLNFFWRPFSLVYDWFYDYQHNKTVRLAKKPSTIEKNKARRAARLARKGVTNDD